MRVCVRIRAIAVQSAHRYINDLPLTRPLLWKLQSTSNYSYIFIFIRFYSDAHIVIPRTRNWNTACVILFPSRYYHSDGIYEQSRRRLRRIVRLFMTWRVFICRVEFGGKFAKLRGRVDWIISRKLTRAELFIDTARCATDDAATARIPFVRLRLRFVSGTHVRKSQRQRIIMSVEILPCEPLSRPLSPTDGNIPRRCNIRNSERLLSLARSIRSASLLARTKIRLGSELRARNKQTRN